MSTADLPPSSAWEERYLGGSEAAEAEAIARWSAEIQQIQRALRAKQPDAPIRRGFHAKQRAASPTPSSPSPLRSPSGIRRRSISRG